MAVEKKIATPCEVDSVPCMAHNNEKKSQTRLIIAGTLFFASIFASFLISYFSHQGGSLWVAVHPVAKGVQIEAADVRLVSANFADGVRGYLSDSANPIGSIARRVISAGELLNISALSESADDLTTESLSLSIRSSDIPASTMPGDVVTLYQVHDARNGEVAIEPLRVLSGVYIKEISQKGANFGSDLSLTVSLHRDDIPRVLSATASGRIVVVASRG